MARKNRRLRVRFGKALRDRRLAAGVTQLDLAVASGLSEVYISRLERGINSPSVEALAELAKALGAKSSDLLKDAGE
jgi:transcriptional regulator with XRE-family HTH domain